MNIRKATVQDHAAIGRIQLASWHTMFPDAGIEATNYLAQFTEAEQVADWQELLSDSDQIVYVAETAAGEVIGYILGRIDHEDIYPAEIVSIHILPAFRSQGAGRLLIKAIVGDFQQRGLTSVHLWVLAGNRARQLYERLGGQVIGQQVISPTKNDVSIEIEEIRYGWLDIRRLSE